MNLATDNYSFANMSLTEEVAKALGDPDFVLAFKIPNTSDPAIPIGLTVATKIGLEFRAVNAFQREKPVGGNLIPKSNEPVLVQVAQPDGIITFVTAFGKWRWI